MPEPAIAVRGLSKRYLISHEARQDTLRDSLQHGVRQAWSALRSLRRRGARGSIEEFWALRDVGFEVERGAVVGVVGGNGAGKSTLLKVLSRITEPTTGRIELRGRVASLLEVGTGFHPELSGRENIYLNGAILGMSRIEIRARFDEIVAFAGVERFLDTPVKRYSSGMYVRLAFAVAAHLEPEILILDEVLAVGDAEFQAKCLGKIESIARSEGRTILLVSHNMNAISRFCSRALLLAGGRLALDGITARVVERYLAPEARAGISLFDLSKRRCTTDSPVELRSLELNGGAPVVHRQPLRAVVVVEVRTAHQPFGLGIGLCRMDGSRVLTLESDHDAACFRPGHPGLHRFEMILPSLDLVPGRYIVAIGAFDAGHRELHYVADSGVVDVQPGERTAVHVLRAYGDYRTAAQWSLTSPAT